MNSVCSIMGKFNTEEKTKMYKLVNRAFIFLGILSLAPGVVFASSNMAMSKAFGGNGGIPFIEMVAPGGRITEVVIRSGAYIDKIGLSYRYGNHNTRRSYGGNGGQRKIFKLQSGEVITEIGGRSGKFVDSIYVITNKGRKMSWGGKGGSKRFRFKGTPNNPIVGIWGRSGAYVDAIGIVRKSGAGGGIPTGGNLNSYDPPPPDTGQVDPTCTGKCDSVTSRTFPTPPSSARDWEFWNIQNQRLYRTVEKLAGSSDVFGRYLDKERNSCNQELFCEIDTRSEAISHVIGVQ